MAKNHVESGKAVTYANAGTTTIYSGSVVVMGKIIGIALVDIPAGGKGAVSIEEVFRLPKESGAMSIGSAAYWDTGAKQIVAASATGTVPAGIVAAEAGASAASVNVKINVFPEAAPAAAASE